MAALQPTQQLSLEGIGDSGFLSYLKSLEQKPKTTIRVFDRNDYYTVHNEDAEFAAKEFFKTTTVIKELGNKKVPSVALSKMNFENFIRDLLLIRQYRVELYRNKASKSNQWELVGKASPGNLQQFEEILFSNIEMSISAIVMSLKVATDENGQRLIAASFADVSSRQFHVCEFVENEQFSNVEALLMQISPKECLLQHQDTMIDGGKLNMVLQRSNILITDRKKVDYNCKDIVQDLNRLLKKDKSNLNSASISEVDLTHAMSCLSSLIRYLELLGDESSFNQFSLKTFDLSQYMRLDAAAVKALNITPSLMEGGNKSMSLYGLLNVCKTSHGQRLLGQWVKQPLVDEKKIDERLDLVDGFFQDINLRQSIQDGPIRRIPDLSRLSKKFHQKRSTLQDCVRVYQSISQLPKLIALFQEYEGEFSNVINDVFTKPFKDSITDFCKFMDLIETTIDLSQVENHEFLIKAEFDEALQECKDNMDSVSENFPAELNKTARDLGLEAGKTVKLESNSQIGHYFRITLKEEKVLRNNKRYTTLETRKDGVRFTNSSLKSLSVEFKAYKESYNELQTQLANEVIKVASGYAEPMQVLSDLIAYLDVLLSLATVAAQAPIPFVRPKIHPKGSGKLILMSSRHPCLEVQDDVAFIANDIQLVKGEQEFLIITGPNMGGKSTYIRQIGLITLMAQIGSFVPCESANVTIVDSILARVGAGDSQLKGVSTFMAEMLETASILRSATENSLIIIDELGRGTSTYDGFGLAWAISEHIASQLNSFCLFATHFHELTALADEIPTVKNFHVTALTSKEQLTLLYRVKPGVCDQSFGIHVAELAHFPKHVIEFAKNKAKELEDFQVTTEQNDSIVIDAASDAKKRRTERKDGEKLVESLLEKLSSIPIHGRTDDEIFNDVQKIKQEALSLNNKYITNFLVR